MPRKRMSEDMAERTKRLLEVVQDTLDRCEGCIAAGLDMQEERQACIEQQKVLRGLLQEFGPLPTGK